MCVLCTETYYSEIEFLAQCFAFHGNNFYDMIILLILINVVGDWGEYLLAESRHKGSNQAG